MFGLFRNMPMFYMDAPTDGGGAPTSGNDDWATNPYDGGEDDEEVTLTRSEARELAGFRRQFPQDYQHNSEDFESRSKIDMARYKEATSLADIIDENPVIYDVVEEILKAAKEGRDPDLTPFSKKEVKQAQQAIDNAGGTGGQGADNGKNQNQNQNQATSQTDERIKKLEKENQDRKDAELRQKFDSGYESAIKDLKLSEREKSALRRGVEETFLNDDKLTMNDIEKVVKAQFKEIEEYRNEILKTRNDSLLEDDDEPNPITGGAPSVPSEGYDPSKASSEERVSAVGSDLKRIFQK